MNVLTLKTSLTAAVATLLLTACGSLPYREKHAIDAPAVFKAASGLPAGNQFNADWWVALEDQALTGLIERGLAANLDLKQAAERVQRSRALAAAAKAGLAPTGGLSAHALATQYAATEMPGQSDDARRLNRLGVDMSFNWEIDLFNRIGSSAAAAESRADASAAEAQALRLAVAAEIAHAWFALIGAREQSKITADVIRNRRATLALVTRRASIGYSAPIDTARASADLAAAEADAPVYETLIDVATHRLAVLSGASPSTFNPPLQPELPPYQVQLAVPSPAQWLFLRPDLRAAESILAAHDLDVEAVRAEFMPRLSVTGVLGFIAGSLSGLGASNSASWFVSPIFSVPLFDYPRIEARLAAAEAKQREALHAYRQKVLLATEEVENALTRVKQGQRQLASLRERVIQSVMAERLARKRYEAGASDLLELLDAQRNAQKAELGLVAALTLQRQNVVTMYRSLGASFKSTT